MKKKGDMEVKGKMVVKDGKQQRDGGDASAGVRTKVVSIQRLNRDIPVLRHQKSSHTFHRQLP